MDAVSLVATASIVTAGLTIAIGSIGPALGEGKALSQALSSIAQQPDEANTITRTLFVGLAMVFIPRLTDRLCLYKNIRRPVRRWDCLFNPVSG